MHEEAHNPELVDGTGGPMEVTYVQESKLEDTLDPKTYKALEQRTRLKLDIQLVPLCLLLYFLSFLDRTNIAQAQLTGMNGDLHLSEDGHDYAVALTVLFPLYIALEIPSNLFLRFIGARIWIPLLVVCWGIIATLQGIVQSKYGLYINRIFLGAAEAGILPGLAVYLTDFYRPREIQLRQALFFTGASLSGAFSGLLATAIGNMGPKPTHPDGIAGMKGWRWIFILEGIFTVLVGFLAFFILPNSVDKCWWLTDTERRLAVERLADANVYYREREELRESMARVEHTDKEGEDVQQPRANTKLWQRETLRIFTDVKLLLMCAIGFCCSAPLYAIANYAPTIVKNMGHYNDAKTKLMSCPPYAASFAYAALISFVSDYFQLRFITAFPGLILGVIGFAVMLGSDSGAVQYGGLFIASCGVFSLPPALFSWVSNNNAGKYKRATAVALLIVSDNCGGMTSPWIYYKKRYHQGNGINLALCAFGALVVLVVEALILYERKKRDSGQRDHRALELRRAFRWSEEDIRTFLGDKHPEYHLEI